MTSTECSTSIGWRNTADEGTDRHERPPGRSAFKGSLGRGCQGGMGRQRRGQVRRSHFRPSLPSVFYIARKVIGLERANLVMTLLLEAFEIIPIERSTLEAAIALPGNDFEDKLQIASAIAIGVDVVVTRDPRGFADSSVIPLSPPEFLQRLTSPPTERP